MSSKIVLETTQCDLETDFVCEGITELISQISILIHLMSLYVD